MHIILGLLGTIVTILVLLNRLSENGIDIGWLNPFTWRRRRAWRKKYEGNPIFSLEAPLDVAALLATSMAKIDGEMSREEKAVLLGLFQSEFGKSEKEASDLLMSSIYLFGDGQEALSKPEKIMQRSLPQFNEEQARSVLDLLQGVLKLDSANEAEKQSYLDRITAVFDAKFTQHKRW